MTRNSPIVLFVMVKFIVWGAFALGLKACLANLWSYTSDNEHFGLWKTCTGTTSKNCEKITADATLNASERWSSWEFLSPPSEQTSSLLDTGGRERSKRHRSGSGSYTSELSVG